MPFARVNDIELYFAIDGPPTGGTLVFLHGRGGNHLSWWQQIHHFSERWRCIAIDQRGFGMSADPQRRSVRSFADDLKGLLDLLDVDRAVLIAQSMGGNTATELAARFPQRVAALVLSSTPGMLLWPELVARLEALRDARLPRSQASIEYGYMSAGYTSTHPAEIYLYRAIQQLNSASTEYTGTPFSPKWIASRLQVPALFIVGSCDPVVAPEVIRELQQAVPDSEYYESQGAGHSVYWEHPDEFNRVVDRFLERIHY